VSPQNSATITTSRKPAEAKIVKMVKFTAPEVARSTRSVWPGWASLGPASANAPTRISGSTTRKPSANAVRRRLACRTASTRSGSARRATRRRSAPGDRAAVLIDPPATRSPPFRPPPQAAVLDATTERAREASPA
jgi:hypothetical protein